MEYALYAATVSIAWSEYFLIKPLGGAIPMRMVPFALEQFTDASGVLHQGYLNAPALRYFSITDHVADQGNSGKCFCECHHRICKVAIVLIFIVVGWHHPIIQPQSLV